MDWDDFYRHLKNLSLFESSIFICLAITVLACGTIRWQVILNSMGQTLPFRYLFQATLIGHSFSQCLPSSVGGDVYRVIAAQRGGVPLKVAILSNLVDRSAGFFGLCILVILTLPFEWAQLSETFLFWPILMVLVGGLSLMLCLWALPHLPEKIISFPGLRNLLIPLRELSLGLRQLDQFKRAIAYTLLTSFGLIGEFYYLNLALELNMSLSLMLLTMPLVLMFMSLPISLAGWGLREGAMVVILGVYGIPREDALLLSLAYGVLILLAAVPGILIWSWRLRTAAR